MHASTWFTPGRRGLTTVGVLPSIAVFDSAAAHEPSRTLAGVGIALLPTYLVGADLHDGALQPALEAHQVSAVSIWAVYLRNRHLSPKTRAFIDFFFERFSPHPPWAVAQYRRAVSADC